MLHTLLTLSVCNRSYSLECLWELGCADYLADTDWAPKQCQGQRQVLESQRIRHSSCPEENHTLVVTLTRQELHPPWWSVQKWADTREGVPNLPGCRENLPGETIWAEPVIKEVFRKDGNSCLCGQWDAARLLLLQFWFYWVLPVKYSQNSPMFCWTMPWMHVPQTAWHIGGT